MQKSINEKKRSEKSEREKTSVDVFQFGCFSMDLQTMTTELVLIHIIYKFKQKLTENWHERGALEREQQAHKPSAEQPSSAVEAQHRREQAIPCLSASCAVYKLKLTTRQIFLTFEPLDQIWYDKIFIFNYSWINEWLNEWTRKNTFIHQQAEI